MAVWIEGDRFPRTAEGAQDLGAGWIYVHASLLVLNVYYYDV
jgi:hypothetical protein